MANKNLHKAKTEKNDEFYTQLVDIENELKHYKDHFKGKVVLCNCDDPRVSNFFHYFSYNFEYLGLKKLITTCYKNQNMDLFTTKESEKAIYLEYEGIAKVGNAERERERESNLPAIKDIQIKHLKGDGDFRSDECIELLKQADIVVTNPPFSLFREYVSQLVEHNKKFLIIGNQNSIASKEIFKFIKENKLFLGLTYPKKFIQPNGDIKIFGNISWFTNLEYPQRYEDLILYKKYNPQEYPHYDNYNAINIDKTKDIPMDWNGYMGVPITFLDKYNPNQFEIVGADFEIKEGLHPKLIKENWDGKIDRGYIKGERLYARIIIKNKKPQM